MARVHLPSGLTRHTGGVETVGKAGAFQPGAMLKGPKIGTGHRKSAKERAEERKKKKNKRRR